ncbi:MAG: hypothetical protein SFU99_12050 [Saprospiraceae bacterium]|nr:hypothetical protein [Saprospiraceae bacterium]
MKKIAYFSLLMLFLFSCGKSPKTTPFSKNLVAYLIFMDVGFGNEINLWETEVQPKLNNLLNANLNPEPDTLPIQPMKVVVYPINHETEQKRTLLNYELDEAKYKQDAQYQGLVQNQLDEISDALQSNIFDSRNNAKIFKVLGTIDIINDEIQKLNEGDKLYVVYLSDMVEMSGIEAQENNGFFSFATKDSVNQYVMNALSVSRIKSGAENGNLLAYNRPVPSLFDDRSVLRGIYVYRPNAINPIAQDGSLGGTYTDIMNFWKILFKKISNGKHSIRNFDNIKSLKFPNL